MTSHADRHLRIALVHRFFHPDVTSYAQMLDQFASHLAGLGHEVTVLAAPPSYHGAYTGPRPPRVERRSGVTVRRLRVPSASTRRGKVVGSAVFPIRIALHVITRRHPYDVVSVTTIPPVVMGLAGRVGRVRSRATRLVYHCMDLYPEVAATIGLNQGGVLARLASRLDRSTMRAADSTIVLSSDMRETARRRGLDGAALERVHICNNFILDSASPDDAIHETGAHPDDLRLVFAGNVGRFQGIETLIDGLERAIDDGVKVHLTMIGSGPLVPWVTEQAQRRSLPVDLLPHRPLREAMDVMQLADMGVVSLEPGVAATAFPSKLMTYLELGLPVFTVVEHDTELAKLIVGEGLGVVCEPGNARGIADAISRAAALELPARGVVQATGRRNFARDVILPRWTELYGVST